MSGAVKFGRSCTSPTRGRARRTGGIEGSLGGTPTGGRSFQAGGAILGASDLAAISAGRRTHRGVPSRRSAFQAGGAIRAHQTCDVPLVRDAQRKLIPTGGRSVSASRRPAIRAHQHPDAFRWDLAPGAAADRRFVRSRPEGALRAHQTCAVPLGGAQRVPTGGRRSKPEEPSGRIRPARSAGRRPAAADRRSAFQAGGAIRAHQTCAFRWAAPSGCRPEVGVPSRRGHPGASGLRVPLGCAQRVPAGGRRSRPSRCRAGVGTGDPYRVCLAAWSCDWMSPGPPRTLRRATEAR